MEINERLYMNIAVIDDGVNEQLYNTGPLQFNIEILPDLTENERKRYDPLLSSHGTTCAAIIKKYAPDAAVGSIKMLNDESKRGVKYQLIKALRWCTGNGVKLVNLSLGSIDFRDFEEIKDCINDAADQGLILIAACNNRNIYTVPACLTNVIGVKCRRIYSDNQYKFYPYPFDGIDIAASGRHFLTDVFGNGRYTSPANSFAAPLVTALAYGITDKNPGITLEGLKKELYAGAVRSHTDYGNDDYYDPYLCIAADWYTEGRESRKVWDAGLYRTQLQKNLSDRYEEAKNGETDIPVILIYEPGNTDVLYNLSSLFKRDGYYTVGISTGCADIYRGSEYLPDNIEIRSFISAVYRKYNCDIMLIKTGNEKFIEAIEKTTEVDIKLYVKDTNVANVLVKGSAGDALEPVEFECNSQNAVMHVEDIYNRILMLFEKT